MAQPVVIWQLYLLQTAGQRCLLQDSARLRCIQRQSQQTDGLQRNSSILHRQTGQWHAIQVQSSARAALPPPAPATTRLCQIKLHTTQIQRTWQPGGMLQQALWWFWITADAGHARTENPGFFARHIFAV